MKRILHKSAFVAALLLLIVGISMAAAAPAGEPHTGDEIKMVLQNEATGLGNYVWWDENEDGVQNEISDRGINDITVYLFFSMVADGSLSFAGSVVTATGGPDNAPGYYEFTGLVPTNADFNYAVGFLLPNAAATGYTGFTMKNSSSGTSATDSDPDPSSGVTDPVSLSSGEFITSLDAGLVGTPNAVTMVQPVSAQGASSQVGLISGVFGALALTAVGLFFYHRRQTALR